MVKTLIVAQPHLQEAYSKTRPSATRGDKSFQILGCDVLIDENLKVWLLEVNRSPSFASSMSKMDFHIKHGLVKDALQMVLARLDEMYSIRNSRSQKKVSVLLYQYSVATE